MSSLASQVPALFQLPTYLDHQWISMIGQIIYSSMVFHHVEMKEDYDFEFVLSQNIFTLVTTPLAFPI